MAEHDHHHGITTSIGTNRAFIIGIILNLIYVLVQIGVGLNINSLSLLSDAGHNFLDVAGLALAMLAFQLSNSKATEKYTYGYRKVSILISLLNAVVLFISIGAIGYEAIFRFQNPEPLPGKVIAIIAVIGILINGVSAFMFFRNNKKDINVRAAFLHLASDALVSFGLVVGGIMIYFTQWYWIDPLLSIIICMVIILSTWRLLKDSLRLSLDGVPENVNIEKVRQKILQYKGINGLHHIHIWAVSTTQNAMTGHLVIDHSLTNHEIAKLKESIKHELEHINIHHATFETEFEDEKCTKDKC